MEVKEYIKKYGRNWAIAAIVEGSIGYYTPILAKDLIERYLQGKKKCYSERCMALYGCDLERMLLSDFQVFERYHQDNQEKIIQKVMEWLKYEENKEMEEITDMMMSMAYPTLGW